MGLRQRGRHLVVFRRPRRRSIAPPSGIGWSSCCSTTSDPAVPRCAPTPGISDMVRRGGRITASAPTPIKPPVGRHRERISTCESPYLAVRFFSAQWDVARPTNRHRPARMRSISRISASTSASPMAPRSGRARMPDRSPTRRRIEPRLRAVSSGIQSRRHAQCTGSTWSRSAVDGGVDVASIAFTALRLGKRTHHAEAFLCPR